MKQNSLLLSLIMTLLLFLVAAPQNAQAAICQDNNNQEVTGFTTAVVYCVKNTIKNAILGDVNKGTTGYLKPIVTFLLPYLWAAVMLSVVMMGIKLATLGVEEVLRETMELVSRIAIAVYLIYNAGYLYDASLSIMGELVSIVSTGFINVANGDVGQSACFTQAQNGLPQDAVKSEYVPWVGIDCMANALLGVATGPVVVTTSLVVIIGAALFSGTLGLAVIIMAIMAIGIFLLAIMRAVYVFILSYFILAMLIVITPLIAPLLIFENGYTREFFWKWVELILSTIIQPMFIIGFLSFMVMVENVFVNGTDQDLPNCKLETFSGLSDSTQNEGICSFKQILNGKDPKSYTNSRGKIGAATPINDPQTHSKDGNFFQTIIAKGAEALNQVGQAMADIVLKGFTRLFNFPLKSLFITLVTFCVVTWVMRVLLGVIPDMAKEVTGSLAVALSRMAEVPLESAMRSAGSAAKGAAHSSTSMAGGGGMKGLKSAGGGLASGGSAAVNSIVRNMQR